MSAITITPLHLRVLAMLTRVSFDNNITCIVPVSDGSLSLRVNGRDATIDADGVLSFLD